MLGLSLTKTLKKREAELTSQVEDYRVRNAELSNQRKWEAQKRGLSQVRIGRARFDRHEIQTRCRRLVESLYIQPIQDGDVVDWLFYADRPLTDAEYNGIEGILGFKLDRS